MNDLDELDDDLEREPLVSALRRLVPDVADERAEAIFRARKTRRRRNRHTAMLASAAMVAIIVARAVALTRATGPKDLVVGGIESTTTSATVVDTTETSGPTVEGPPDVVEPDQFTCPAPMNPIVYQRQASSSGNPTILPPSVVTAEPRQAIADQWRGPHNILGLELEALPTSNETELIVNGWRDGEIVVRFFLHADGPGLVLDRAMTCGMKGPPTGGRNSEPGSPSDR